MCIDKTQQLKYKHTNGSKNTLVRATFKIKWHNKIEIKVGESYINQTQIKGKFIQQC